MKKILSIVILTAFLLSIFTACTITGGSVPTKPATTTNRVHKTTGATTAGSTTGSTTATRPSTTTARTDKVPPATTTGGTQAPAVPTYTYTAFTPAEKEMFTQLFGEVIPFIPNNEYYVEAYTLEGETGINLYTLGNIAADFDAYRALFTSYALIDTYTDEYGDAWYTYQKGEYYVDMSYYTASGVSYIDVYAYILTGSGEGGGGTGGDIGGGDTLYTDFTDAEKSLFLTAFGEVIPFLSNTQYSVEAYSLDDEEGINFYTFGNTAAEFNAYRALFTAYTLIDTYTDEYGDAWYTYQKGEYYVDMSHYEYDTGVYCVDVYAYILTGSGEGGGGTGGDIGGGDIGGGDENADLLTNYGKGLPAGVDGIFNVDLTQAEYVKNVTDQGYYEGGCPTVGTPGVLVIPVEFSDATAESLGYDVSVISNAFMKDGVTDYHSVYDYYQISSYGQLELDITVLDFWFRPQYSSTYYQNATIDYFGDQVAAGDQMIMNEALAYLEGMMDLSAFDSDKNGIIDAVVMINTLDVGEDDFHWAYRYWNIYTNENDEYYEYDGVSANDYVWACYQFLHQSVDASGNEGYDDTTAVNTYTYIHEFGHVLGADDYYDTAGKNEPMGGCDMMDAMMGDHNAFTKFNLGWITSSRLVTAEGSVTLTLSDFTTSGDTVILANNWDPDLGAYQEYYIIAYYRGVGLNEAPGGYFLRDGIVVYHVNATLYREEIDGIAYYDVYYNNTDASDEYGSTHNLIEYVKSDAGNYTYVAGDSLSAATDDGGNSLAYTFIVDAMTDESATVTFTKAA